MDDSDKETVRQFGRVIAGHVQVEGYSHNAMAQRIEESDRLSYEFGLRIGFAINGILADMEDPD